MYRNMTLQEREEIKALETSKDIHIILNFPPSQTELKFDKKCPKSFPVSSIQAVGIVCILCCSRDNGCSPHYVGPI